MLPKNTTNGISDLSPCGNTTERNTILFANIDACALSTSYEQDLKTPKIPTSSTIKPRLKSNAKIALHSTTANNKIKFDRPLSTRSKSQVPEWLSRLPLAEIQVDNAVVTSALRSQQGGADNSDDYDKESSNRSEDFANSQRTTKSTKQVSNSLRNPTTGNPGENKENIGLVPASSIAKCRQISTSYEQDLKTPKIPTGSTIKPRLKSNAKIALHSTTANNKIKFNRHLSTRSKSQVPEWLSRLPLAEIQVDNSHPPLPKRQRTKNPPPQYIGRPRSKSRALECQSPFPKRQKTKNPPYQHIGCPRMRDWLGHLDFVRQTTRTRSNPSFPPPPFLAPVAEASTSYLKGNISRPRIYNIPVHVNPPPS